MRNIYHIAIKLAILAAFLPITEVKAQIFMQGYHDSVFTEYFRPNSGGWTAGDATISVSLPDGRTIWLFGDSYLENVDTTNNTLSCLFQIRNCMVVQDSTDPSILTTYFDEGQSGVLRSTFKLGPNDPAILWPGHGFTDADTAYIYLDEIDGPSMGHLGLYVAKLQLPGLQINGIYPLPDHADIIMGRAVVTDTASGYRYIYGNKNNWIVWEPYVARTLIGTNILAPYQFYTGSGWSYNPFAAAPVSSDYVSPGFSVFKMNNKFYLLTQENGLLTCSLGREIYIMESATPWGPFTNKQLVYTIEDQFNGHYTLTYNAQAHPSHTENGELLISYNLNDVVDTTEPYICPSQCKNLGRDRMDADTYRPKFIRVPILNVGADNLEPVPNIVVSPNPVYSGKPFSLTGLTGRFNLTIFDITGKERAKYISVDNSHEFMPNLSTGVYVLKINPSGKLPITLKLLII
jgi:hypothetical protein